MPLRDPSNPLCWVGYDRLLLDDVSRAGLHRKVIARKDAPPDADAWTQAIRIESPGAEIKGSWLVQKGEFVILWIVWKAGLNA